MGYQKLRKAVTSSGWLSGQSEDFQNLWLEACELRAVAEGDHLYSLGDPSGGVYGLADGFADVLMAASPMPPFLVHIARPGWWVGEAAANTNTPRRVEVRARCDLKVFYVSPRNLEAMENDYPQLWRVLTQLTVSHLDNALMLASSLVKGDIRIKVLNTLVRLAGLQEVTDEIISIPCTQQELGEMAGLSRNSIGPILKKLEQEGLISRKVYGQIAFKPRQINRAMKS